MTTDPPLCTQAQLRLIHILLAGDRAERLAWLSWAVGRTVDSSASLSRREASLCIDLLKAEEAEKEKHCDHVR
jgi:hypothetical protein